MSLTAAQQIWYDKIKKFVPSWWFEKQETNPCLTVAVFSATAAMFSGIEDDLFDQLDATFLMRSTTPVLDAEAAERGVYRDGGESDASLVARAQSLFNTSYLTQIQQLLDAVLNNGTAFIIKPFNYGFMDCDMYGDDYSSRATDRDAYYNFFVVIIPVQTAGDQAAMRTKIITLLEANKALGVSYDVLYLSSSDTDTSD
jgi:hypothetical protein